MVCAWGVPGIALMGNVMLVQEGLQEALDASLDLTLARRDDDRVG